MIAVAIKWRKHRCCRGGCCRSRQRRKLTVVVVIAVAIQRRKHRSRGGGCRCRQRRRLTVVVVVAVAIQRRKHRSRRGGCCCRPKAQASQSWWWVPLPSKGASIKVAGGAYRAKEMRTFSFPTSTYRRRSACITQQGELVVLL